MLILTGCPQVFRDEVPLRHYTLGATVAEEVVTRNGELAGLSIGLRQPRVADYLVTDLIAVRHPPSEIRYAGQHRWAGSLDREIGRALAGYLARRAPFERVDLVPWPRHATYDYVLELEVLRFEGVAPGADNGRDDNGQDPGQAHLRAGWEIIRVLDAEVVASGLTDQLQPGWPAEDYAALVRLLDAALAALADELVSALRVRAAQ